MSEPATVVLVHGAWHGAWCWAPVVDGPVLLVGHSFGGGAITDAGTHPAVRHLVYVTAFCIDTQETVMTNDLEGGAGTVLEQAIRFEAAWRERPSTHALCTDDGALMPALQRNLATRCDDVVEIAASHSPFESRPDELTAVLVDLATRAGA